MQFTLTHSIRVVNRKENCHVATVHPLYIMVVTLNNEETEKPKNF